MELINKSVQAHDCYVSLYEGIGSFSNYLWERAPTPPQIITENAQRIIKKSFNFACWVPCATAKKMIELSNWLIGRPRNQTILRDYRMEIIDLANRAKKELYGLSKLCSVVFDRPLIISSIPSHEETEQLLEKLYSFKENPPQNASRSQLSAASDAIAVCFRLYEVGRDVEQLKHQDISEKDLQDFYTSIETNTLYRLSKNASLENIGEMIGGNILNEAILPSVCNPAVQFGSFMRDKIGRPLGKGGGMVLSLLGAYGLLNKIPLFRYENYRKALQMSAILLLIGAEYFGVNPISNYLEDQLGTAAYNFAFYSIALLFNYLGMVAAGTTEELGEYVRKMTPSTLVYNGVDAVMQYYQFGYVTSLLTSFYLSHVAYNFDVYSNVLQGKSLAEFLECVKEILPAIDRFEIGAVREALVQFVDDQSLDRMEKQFIEVKQKQYLHEGAFLIREFNSFCRSLLNPEMNQLVEAYKNELVKVMEQTKIAEIEAPLELTLSPEGKKGRIFEKIIEGYVDGEYKTQGIQELISLLDNQYLGSLGFELESFINQQIEQLYPLVPKHNSVEEACSLHIIDTLSKAFFIHVLLRVGTGSVSLYEAASPLKKENYIEMVSNISYIIFGVRHPNYLSYERSIRRAGARVTMDSQLNYS